MREINVTPLSIVLEPVRKYCSSNHSLCKALETSSDPTLIVLSSDHKIENEESFKKIINDGLNHLRKEELLNSPKNPETGYGYIESFDELIKITQAI